MRLNKLNTVKKIPRVPKTNEIEKKRKSQAKLKHSQNESASNYFAKSKCSNEDATTEQHKDNEQQILEKLKIRKIIGKPISITPSKRQKK